MTLFFIKIVKKSFDKIKNNEIWSIKLLRFGDINAIYIAIDCTIYFYSGSW